jgi:hypothetical protein
MKFVFWYRERLGGCPPAVTWLWLTSEILPRIVGPSGWDRYLEMSVNKYSYTDHRVQKSEYIRKFDIHSCKNYRSSLRGGGGGLRNWVNSTVEKSENVPSWNFLLLKLGPLISVKSSGTSFPRQRSGDIKYTTKKAERLATSESHTARHSIQLETLFTSTLLNT